MSNVSHLAQGQLQQGQKPHIPTLIISPFLLGFYTSVLQTYSSLAGIVSQNSAIHLLVWSSPFALFAGEERKKKNVIKYGGWWERSYLFIWYHLPVLPPLLCGVLGAETHWTELLFEQSSACCTTSSGTPAGLAAAPPPAFTSPQTENSPCPCLWLLIYTF